MKYCCCEENSDGRYRSRRNWRRMVETRSWDCTKSSTEASLLSSLYVDIVVFGLEFEVHTTVSMRFIIEGSVYVNGLHCEESFKLILEMFVCMEFCCYRGV